MTGALKAVVLVVLSVWATKWLSEEEYGEKRIQRILRVYVSGKAAQAMGR